ncbi:MAG TPA: YgiT-type zinc finger protein [Candidatus Binatia bacterium]|nr:YgiT-type zinc finger protein [Candidatus Binatia bacterium]
MSEQPALVTCEVCKGPMTQELQDYVVETGEGELLIEDVPIWVCEQCGYSFVEEDVIAAVEDMLEHMDTVVAGEEE